MWRIEYEKRSRNIHSENYYGRVRKQGIRYGGQESERSCLERLEILGPGMRAEIEFPGSLIHDRPLQLPFSYTYINTRVSPNKLPDSELQNSELPARPVDREEDDRVQGSRTGRELWIRSRWSPTSRRAPPCSTATEAAPRLGCMLTSLRHPSRSEGGPLARVRTRQSPALGCRGHRSSAPWPPGSWSTPPRAPPPPAMGVRCAGSNPHPHPHGGSSAAAALLQPGPSPVRLSPSTCGRGLGPRRAGWPMFGAAWTWSGTPWWWMQVIITGFYAK